MKTKRALKRLFTVLFTFAFVLCAYAEPALAASKKTNWDIKRTETRVVSTKFVRNEYSSWKRLNNVYKAKSKGETNQYAETKTVKTTSSIDASLSIGQLNTKLGYKVEKTKSNTYFATGCRSMSAGESSAFYYRDHYKVYTVTAEVKEYTNNKLTRTYCKTYTIKVAQKATPNDYGWFYTSGSYKVLAKTLPSSYRPGKIK